MTGSKEYLSYDKHTIKITFQNNDFYIFEKPSGLACHGPNPENLANLLEKNNIKPLLCHRLDKETSGLLIVAKSAAIAEGFRLLFEDKKIEKYYLALSHKKGKKKQGAIKGAMAKSRNGNWKLLKDSQENSTPIFISQFFSFALAVEGHALNKSSARAFLIKITGGKTHQVRVALKSNSSPILGDTRYGGSEHSRLCLHAYALKFTLKEEEFYFISEADFLKKNLSELENQLTNISQPWKLPWPKV